MRHSIVGQFKMQLVFSFNYLLLNEIMSSFLSNLLGKVDLSFNIFEKVKFRLIKENLKSLEALDNLEKENELEPCPV